MFNDNKAAATGDLLLSYDNNFLGIWYHGHAATHGSTLGATIEVLGVGHRVTYYENGLYRNDWINVKNGGRYQVYNATRSQYINAENKTYQQVRKDYRIDAVPRPGNAYFYCSELVWYGWSYGAGINLTGQSQYVWIFPDDLFKSNKTYWVHAW